MCLPVFFLTILVAVVDVLAGRALDGGNLATCRTGSRVLGEFLNSTHRAGFIVLL